MGPNANMPVISTTLLNWNRADLLRRTLESYARTITVPYEIFIIDNASTDNSREVISDFCAHVPNAEAVFLDQNRGGEAINVGLERSSGAYLHISENDLEYLPGWAEKVVDLFDCFPSLGQLSLFGPVPSDEEAWEVKPSVLRHARGRIIYEALCNVGTASILRREVWMRGVRVRNYQSPGTFLFPDDAQLSTDIKDAGYAVAWADQYLVRNLGHAVSEFEGREEYYRDNYASKPWLGTSGWRKRMADQKSRVKPVRTSFLFPAEGISPEKTEPNRECAEPYLWSMLDGWTAEVEALEFLYALVRLIKPSFAIETGTWHGYAAAAIGRALRENGRGELETLEIDRESYEVAQQRVQRHHLEPHVRVLNTRSLEHRVERPIDFLLLDSDLSVRGEEFRKFEPHLSPEAIVVFHDTSGAHHVVRRDIEELTRAGLIRGFFLPIPRGIAVFQYTGKRNRATRSGATPHSVARTINLGKHRSPVCITGMHRSGTSMVARLLNLCGLYLGEEGHLMPANPENPEGYWEHVQFVNLNDDLLSFLGGGWDFPPATPQGWLDDPKLAPLMEKATKLCNEFRNREPWGWKDPRNSLTIDFWKAVFPDIKVVICVRNPREVAKSLHKRGVSSNAFGFHLWKTYNETLLASLEPEQCLITHYESYFINPREELKRVAAFAGLNASEDRLREAAAAIKASLRRNRASTAGLPQDISRLYERLCANAGTIFTQVPAADDRSPHRPADAAAMPFAGADMQYRYALKLAQNGLHDQAAAELEKLVSVHPEYALAHNDLGVLALQQGDSAKARTCYETAVRLEPQNVTFRKNLADFLFVKMGQAEQALALYERIVSSRPDDAEGLLTAGNICISLGRFGQAATFFDRVLTIEPGNAMARQVLTAMREKGLLEQDREPQPAVSIIIPVSNHVEFTARCLAGLAESFVRETTVEVLVVDDASTDGTEEFIRTVYGNHADLQYIRHAENSGFAKTCNTGARAARGEFLVFLNNDTVPVPGWLDALLKTVERHPDTGIVGSKLVFPEATPGPQGERVQHCGIAFNEKKESLHLYKFCLANQPFVNKAREVQAVTGAALLIPRELFLEAGCFDEAYRNGAEDLDLCFKVRALGRKIRYCPESLVYHYESVSTGGGYSANTANYKLFRDRWSERIKADEYDHYRDDGLALPPPNGQRVAMLTPLGPQKTGIGTYMEELLPYLSRHMMVDLFVDDIVPTDAAVLARHRVHRISDLEHADWIYHYDEFLYQIGNNNFHSAIYRTAVARPGVVVLHEYDSRGCSTELSGRIFLQKLFGVAKGAIVHNEHSRELLHKEFPDLPFAVIPLLLSPKAGRVQLAGEPSVRDRLQLPRDCYCIVSLGLVQPHKRNHVTVDAFARVVQQHPNSMLLLAGDAPSQAYRVFIENRIARHGLGDRVRITGWLSEEQFFDYLDAADVTVNLRYPSRGEESATLIRILGSGKPAVISHYAQYADIPADCAVRIGFQNEQNDLADALIRLGRDKALRDQLSGSALRFIRKRNDVERVARLHASFCREMKSVVPAARVLRERRYQSPSRSRTPLLWEAPFPAFSDPSRELVLALDRSGMPARIVATSGEAATVTALNDRDAARLTELEAIPLADEFIQFHAGRLDAFRKRPGAVYSIALVDHATLPAGAVPSQLPVDELWVPSEYSKRMLVSRGIPENRITVIPYGVGAVPFGAAVNEIPLEGPFRFLCVAEGSRKSGWNDVLTAFLREFGGRKDVSLVFKSLAPSGDIAARNRQFQSAVNHYLRTQPPVPDDHLRTITFDPKTYGSDIMPAFYSRFDAFVHPALDTALGRSLMETMALGLPVITTAAAGQADFCTGDNCHIVHHRKTKDGIETDVRHLRTLMRFLVDERLSSQVKGIVARNDILGRWTWNDAAATAAKRIKAILTSPGPQSSHRLTAEVHAGAAGLDGPAVPASASSRSEASSSGTSPIVWHAPIYDPSGYADEARHFLLALADKGFAIAARPMGRHSEHFRAGIDQAQRDRLDRMIARKSEPNAISIVHFPAYAFQRMPGASYHIGRVMFETDGLPQEWVAKCNEMDEIWVPSEFNKETFRNAGVKTKLTRVPAGINTERFRPGLDPLPIKGRRGTVFLSVFEWTYRKGWDVLLAAWARAFRPEDDACLVLRAYPLNVVESTNNGQLMHERIDHYLRNSLGLARKDVAPIIVMGGQVVEADLPRLYAAATAYVAPSRGEGWGRPHMEAMACGLPVIATNWSGNREFMTEDNSYLLNIVGLVEVDERAEIPFYRGQRWAEPDPLHLVKLMGDISTRPEEARRIGARARQDMEQSWTWSKQADTAAGRLREISEQLSSGQRPDRAGSPATLTIRWEGSQFVRHSLALVNREICIRLAKDPGIELSVIPYEKDQFSAASDARFARIVQNLRRPLSRSADVHVRHQWPPKLIPPDEGHWVLMQPWEFGSLPKEWKEAVMAQVDEVWAYTTYGRDVYVQSGIPADRVHIIPLGVDCGRFTPSARPLGLRTKKRFKFLFVGGTIYRKGIDILLEAYTRAFTKADDVCLVIKDMGGDSFYRGQTAQEMIARFRSAAGAPEFEYIDRFLSEDELVRLYAACDCLVHPYRGEGFGLPLAEAMACGLPVITTGYGASLDFCSSETAYLIPARKCLLAEKRVGALPTVDYPWLAEPDRPALEELMKQVAAHPEEARTKGRAASEYIRSNFTWERTVEMVKTRVRELRERPLLRRAPVTTTAEDRRQVVPGLVSIVIPASTAERENIKTLVQSIAANTPLPHELLFAVDSQHEGNAKWLRQLVQEQKHYSLVRSGADAAPAHVLNQGLAAARGEFILLMNSDVVVTKNWISGMLECLTSAPDIGIVGPMTNSCSGPQMVPVVGYNRPDQLDAYAAAFREKNRGRRVFVRRVAGFCMLFKKHLLDEINGLDERFGSGNFEDDLCLRSALAGCRNVIAGDVFIHHHGSRTLLGNKDDYRNAMLTNEKYFTQKWSDIDPRSPQGQGGKLVVLNAVEKARAAADCGDIEAAVQAILAGIGHAPETAVLYTTLAEIFLDAQRFQDALETLQQMPEAEGDPKRPALIGYCKDGLGLPDEAAEYADQALALDGQSALALNLKAMVAYKRGERAEAEQLFLRSRDADPSYAEPWTNLGVLQWAEGKRDEALARFEKGFILSPTASDIATAFQSAFTELQQFMQAEPVVREALALHPRNKRLKYLLIDLLMNSGQNAAALAEIEQAMLAYCHEELLPFALKLRETVGPLGIDRTNKKRPSVSLCMIVKNEQRFIARCLTAAKNIADEIIVVDTGSTDKTRDLALAFGARVYDVPWTEDFSAARNSSLEKATGDWILVLDADELIAPRDADRLRELVTKSGPRKTAWAFYTRNYVTVVNTSGWTANNGAYCDEEAGTGWFPSIKVRLFPNDKHIRFAHPVHEMVEPSLKKLNIPVKESPVPVHHYGKLNEKNDRAKGEAYYELGKKKIEELGDDVIALTELAIQARILGKYDEAVELWQRVLRIKPDFPIAWFNMGSGLLELKRYDEALAASKKAKELSPDQKEIVYNYAICELYAGDVEKSINALENLLATIPDYPVAKVMLAAASCCAGKAEKGMELFTTLRDLNFGFAEYLAGFAENLIAAGRQGYARALLDAARESGNVNAKILDLLSRCSNQEPVPTATQ